MPNKPSQTPLKPFSHRSTDSGIFLSLWSNTQDVDDYALTPEMGYTERQLAFITNYQKIHPYALSHLTPWVFGSPIPADLAHNALNEIHAVIKLLNQTVIMRTHERASKGFRRRAEKAELAQHNITIIRLRRPRHAQNMGEHHDVEWTHRWMVSGHWRKQPYPSLLLRLTNKPVEAGCREKYSAGSNIIGPSHSHRSHLACSRPALPPLGRFCRGHVVNARPTVAAVQFRVGRVLPFGPNGEPSGIDKHPVARPLMLTVSGFEGDEQGDRRHHGGPEKAVHHYPEAHYAAWRREFPERHAHTFRAGAFGENLVSAGLTEANVCIGDVFRLGAALIQVSQARQPCWKLNLRFGIPDMSRRLQDSGRTGWYYRVLEQGKVAPFRVQGRHCLCDLITYPIL